ncbi:MAG: CinA family protein [Lachnospiraceae bacterium]|nr:CinA family protein [Lachnospiraceae bacterium]
MTDTFTELFSVEENAARLVEVLQAIGQTVATAESCTGGMVSSAIVSVPGASNVFGNGFITYCDEAKHRLLQVSQETLDTYTAVSAETAAEMAYGCAAAGQADLALAVTGLAGPGGGTEEKPVGLVYVSCCYHDRILVQEYHFQGDREAIRRQAAAAALQLGYFSLRAR